MPDATLVREGPEDGPPPLSEARAIPRAPALVRGAFRLLSAASPGVAARLLSHLFMRPPPARPLRPESVRALGRGQATELRADGTTVRAWRWGGGSKRVLLVHGWGGRGSQLLPFVDPLLARGFQVWMIDAPAHGESRGSALVLPQKATLLHGIRQELGGLDAIVAHSFGAAAAALASRETPVAGRLALLAPPGDVQHFTRMFARAFGASDAVHHRMVEGFERRHGTRFVTLRADAVAMDQPAPTLIVHDADDASVPLEHGEWLHRAWSGTTLLRTSGLGHKGVLKDPAVVDRVVRFVADGPATGEDAALHP